MVGVLAAYKDQQMDSAARHEKDGVPRFPLNSAQNDSAVSLGRFTRRSLMCPSNSALPSW